MNYLRALGVKFVFVTIIILSIFGIFHNASLNVLFGASIVISLITFLVGDLFLLPRFGNVVASVADFGLVFVLLWGLDSMFINVTGPVLLSSLAAAFFITSCEPLFHAYVEESVLKTRRIVWPPFQLDTEFSEELNLEMSSHDEDPEDELDTDN